MKKALSITVFFFLFLLPLVSAFPQNSDLLGYWRFDGDFLDQVSQEYGSGDGFTAAYQGHIGNATYLLRDNSSGPVTLSRSGSHRFQEAKPFSFSFWFKSPSFPGNATFPPGQYQMFGRWLNIGSPEQDWGAFSGDNTSAIDFSNLGYVSCVVAGQGPFFTVLSKRKNLDDNQYHFMVCSYDSTTKNLTLYLDGEVDNSAFVNITNSGSAVDGYTTLREHDGSRLEIKTDEAGIWNKTLTPEDVGYLYAAGRGRQYPIDAFGYPNGTAQFKVKQITGGEDFQSLILVALNVNIDAIRYAIDCDYTTGSLWSELFSPGYNFTTRNTSISVDSPTISTNGVTVLVNDTSPVEITKFGNTAERQPSSIKTTLEIPGNSSVAIIALGGNGDLAAYVIFERTQLNGTYDRVNGTVVSPIVGSLALENRLVLKGQPINLRVDLTPRVYTITGGGTQTQYESFQPSAYVNDVVIDFTLGPLSAEGFYGYLSTASSTYMFPSKDVKDVVLSVVSKPNQTTTANIKGLSLEKAPSYPEPVTFHQGSIETSISENVTGNLVTWVAGKLGEFAISTNILYAAFIGVPELVPKNPPGLTEPVLVPSPEGLQIDANGFTVYPGLNNEFFSACFYPGYGTYKQRHYLMSEGFDDYSNYKDLTVEVRNFTTYNVDQGLGGPENPYGPGGDNPINSFFQSIGIKTQSMGFLVWLVILTVGVGYLVYATKSWALGVIVFAAGLVAGGMLGIVPLYVIILVVVIAAGIFALGLRSVMTGA
jgi:hypothetical protein